MADDSDIYISTAGSIRDARTAEEIEHDRRASELSRLPVTISDKGVIMIGDERFPYHTLQDSIGVQHRPGKYNLLTVTIPVGAVTMTGSEGPE